MRNAVRRKAESQIDAPGQDSFLDVVCNLVGILIVLVMLIAAQAKRGMIAAANAKPAAGASDNGPLEEEAKSAESTAAALEASINELDSKIDQEQLATAMREEERSRFQIMVTVAEQRLAEYREQLSEDEKVRYDLQRELVASKGELASLSTT